MSPDTTILSADDCDELLAGLDQPSSTQQAPGEGACGGATMEGACGGATMDQSTPIQQSPVIHQPIPIQHSCAGIIMDQPSFIQLRGTLVDQAKFVKQSYRGGIRDQHYSMSMQQPASVAIMDSSSPTHQTRGGIIMDEAPSIQKPSRALFIHQPQSIQQTPGGTMMEQVFLV